MGAIKEVTAAIMS